MRDYTLEFEVRVESTFRDLRELLVCCRELLDATVEDYDEMGRAYEVKLTTLRAELEQKSVFS